MVVKIAPDGMELWTKMVGTVENDECWDILIDSDDYPVVVGGSAGDMARHDNSTTPQGSSFVNAGDLDFMLVKLTPQGEYFLTRQWGSQGRDNLKGITMGDNTYVVGQTDGGVEYYSSDNVPDVYIAKYDLSTGAQLWAREYETSDGYHVLPRDIVYVEGIQSVIVSGCSGGSIVGDLNGASDPFIMEVNKVGNYAWGDQSFGTNAAGTWECASGVTVDPYGNYVYVTGTIRESVDGAVVVGGADFFVAKYDLNLGAKSRLWVANYISGINDEGTSIVVGSDDNLYISAFYEGAVGQVGNEGAYDMVLHSYDRDGLYRWSKNWGSNANDFATGLTLDHSGHIIMVGYSEGEFGGVTSSGQNCAIVRTNEE